MISKEVCVILSYLAAALRLCAGGSARVDMYLLTAVRMMYLIDIL